jgi:hypothetical protein
MSDSRRRVFINTNLMRDIDHVSDREPDRFIGQSGAPPLYVMMHLRHPAASPLEFEFDRAELSSIEEQELEELSVEDDADLIDHLQKNPDLFRATRFNLDDGAEAVAFDFAKPRLFTIRRVRDEADWRTVLRTYDPTWMVGPATLRTRRFTIRRKK